MIGCMICKHELIRADAFGTCTSCGERTYSPSGIRLDPDADLRAKWISSHSWFEDNEQLEKIMDSVPSVRSGESQ